MLRMGLGSGSRVRVKVCVRVLRGYSSTKQEVAVYYTPENLGEYGMSNTAVYPLCQYDCANNIWGWS